MMRAHPILVAALLGALLACDPDVKQKVVVIGIDGMDPEILASLIAAGRMPNFKQLAQDGGFVKLGTSNPPQSPVAWANMITGMDSGGHGIFDFVHRDASTYTPKSSAADTEPPGHSMGLGRYVIPLSGGAAHNTRKGRTFWEILADRKIPTWVYRMPANFPPTATSAVTFSGMGTPDLFFGYGTYQLFTDKPPVEKPESGLVKRVTITNGIAHTVLTGPTNTYLKFVVEVKNQTSGSFEEHDRFKTDVEARAAVAELKQNGREARTRGQPSTFVPMSIAIDAENRSVKIELDAEEVLLKEGEWSDWVPVSFEMIPHLGSANGVLRFYLKSCAPDLVLYASPINIDPLAPVTPISTPDDACEKLAAAIGRYYTKGMPEETKALQEGVFDDGDFLKQGRLVMDESRRMLDHALDHFTSGMLFFYFSSVDLNCHMLWRHRDPEHPMHDAKLAQQYGTHIDDLYVEMDGIIGRVRSRLPSDATLIVMSDHGFASFRREMNLNTWLEQQGYLVLRADASREGAIADIVDWSKTRAYSIGFNAIYLNVKGREGQGIVADDPAARRELADEMRTRLLKEVDPKTSERYIPRVYLASEIYHGPQVTDGPDLIVGFGRGYGASDASCLGQITAGMLEDHSNLWSGNHLMAAEVVPGILLSNKKLGKEDPVLQDITVTILNLFGIDKLPEMTGASVLASSKT
ncbi:MAG: alkaline phosphatase family protein [Planctomycetota bacterium]